MLQFILGRAASGKSYEITERIARCVEYGGNPILIVPEQFSFESEKRILDRLGDSGAQKVSVVSFTRLCDEVERIVGGICGKTLTDADKLILISRAVKRAAGELQIWRKYASSAGFAKMMLETISEFKLNAVTAKDISNAAENTVEETLKRKLADTALIYSEYEALLAERFIDPSDRLTKLYYTLENYEFFKGKTVFIDSFKGFTGQQFRIIDRILATAAEITVSFTDNVADNRAFGLFSNIRKTRNRIISLAAAHGVEYGENTVLSYSRYESDDLAAVERLMCGEMPAYAEKAQNVTVCRAETVFDEADFVARNIRRIVREKGARFSDFVVIARDTSHYDDALEAACKKNNVSCFIDRRIPLSALPPAVALLSAVDVYKSFSTEKILRFHKSGINILTETEISTLENYTYLWGIEGGMWKTDWDMSEQGFVYRAETPDNTEFITKINELRRRAVKPLLDFKQNFGGTAADMARAVVQLFESIDAKHSFITLSNTYKAQGNTVLCDAMRQGWDKIMSILDSLVSVFGEAQISTADFCDALESSLSLDTVGVIPQMIDEVTFGAADRIRPSRPKYAFIMGANQNVFPRAQQSSGLFRNDEREKLITLGLDIPDKTLGASVDEEFLVYSNVCCASKQLFISHSATLSDGSAAEPSAFVNDITASLNCNTVSVPAALDAGNIPETVEDTFSMLCNRLPEEGSDAKTLLLALKDKAEIGGRVENVLNFRNRPQFSITPDTAQKLFGDKLYMSPSKFDNFNRCKFMYFCRNGLRAESLQPAQFSAMQRGTMVHFVLQQIIEKYGKDVSKLTAEEISCQVDTFADMYLDGIAGYRSIESPRMKYLVSTVARSLKYVVERLGLEFAQSQFTPVKCELRFGAGDDMPEIKVPVLENGELVLTGIVDRVDSYNGYVRIVDYKTGHRDFRLPDILFGQNMQMLIYLYAICQSDKYGGKPAGIFYMPSSRAKDSTPAKRRMNGLLPADEQLVRAMDSENRGEFVPKLAADPSDSFVNAEDFDKIFGFVDRKLKATGRAIYEGRIAADPVDGIDSPACKYCEYAAVCRIEKQKPQAVPRLSNTQVLEEIERQVSADGI